MFFGEAEACPWNALAQRECKCCPLPLGCVLWSLQIVFNIGHWHCCCFVRLSRPLGNASQFSFKCIPLCSVLCVGLFFVFFFSVDSLTVNPAFACDDYFMTRHDKVFKNFCKFKIIVILAPVKISDNCR